MNHVSEKSEQVTKVGKTHAGDYIEVLGHKHKYFLNVDGTTFICLADPRKTYTSNNIAFCHEPCRIMQLGEVIEIKVGV